MTLALRRHDARVRYWLWAAASVKFFVPFSWLISLGALVEWRTAPTIAQPAATFVVQEILAPPLLYGAVPQVPQDTNIGRWVVLGVWLAGTAVVFFWWGRQWRPLRSALRRATPLLLRPDCDAGGLTVMSSPSAFEPGVVGILRPVLLLPAGAGRSPDAGATRRDPRARACARPGARQPPRGRAHGGRGALLVPPARVVDRAADDRRARACL